jgi:hypothetical protein
VKVGRILEQVADQMKTEESINPQMVRNAIERRFDVDYVDFPKSTDIVIRKEGGGWIMQARYEDLAPLFANASILLQFDKTVTIPQ